MSSLRLVAAVCCSLVVGCSDSGSGGGGTGATGAAGAAGGEGGQGGAGASGSTGGGGSGVVGCEPACVAPQFCSAAGQCIDVGTCLDDDDCTQPGTICDVPSMTCVPGGGCEDLMANIEPVAPNVLLVLDRSCSMTQVVPGGATKWEAAVAAINTFTTDYGDKIRFGLSLFPDLVAPNCAQDVIPVPIAPDSAPAIQTLLTNALVTNDPYFPNGPCVTNIDTAMTQAAAAPELADPTRDSYVALLTDGKQAGCNAAGGDNGTLATIADLLAVNVPTFVLGFGDGVDPDQMNLFAEAGGVPNSGPSYYDAGDQASLLAALEVIATKAISCTFTLDTVPPNSSQIYVFFDQVPVPEDPTMMAGWSYDAAQNQVTFHGTACSELKSGEVEKVDVVLGCSGPQ